MSEAHSRWWAIAGAAVFGFTSLAIPVRARASEEGRRNTAIALGAAAAYLLATQKNKVPGLIAAAGAAYAYKRYDDAIHARHRRERERAYRYGSYRDRYAYRARYDDRYYRDRDFGRRSYRRHAASWAPPGWSKGRKVGWQKHGKRW